MAPIVPDGGQAPAGHATGAEAESAGPDDVRRGPHAYFTVASGSASPAAARAWINEWLDGRVSERTAYDAMLVVSELVTNSVVHSGVAAGDPVQLRANLDVRILRLEVGDLGAGTDIVRIPPPDRLSRGGFGLAIVESLGARWGVVHASGTRVWCELALPATA
jgi:anti-sigma regulatory factor (Ser/Thr protein kinase)